MSRVAQVLIVMLLPLTMMAAPQPLADAGQKLPSPNFQSAAVVPGLQIVPPEITPAYVNAVIPYGEWRDYPLELINTGDETLFISEIVEKRDSVNYLNPDWLTLSTYGPMTIAAGDTVAMSVRVEAPAYRFIMQGAVKFVSSSFAGDTFWLPILCVSSRDSVGILSTSCMSLAVTGTSNLGWRGGGYLNMNFAPPAECDTGTNSRGNASIYLWEASPVIMRKSGSSSYRASWDMFGVEVEYPPQHQFKWLSGEFLSGPITGPGYTSYHSGVFCTIDSLVAMENSWYAPTHPDSCNFIVQKTTLYPRIPNTSVTGLAIGEAVDWDVPSDVPYDNYAGYDTTRSLAYMYGHDKQDDTVDCQPNDVRYAGASLLRMYTSTCGSDPFSLYAAYNVQRDSFRYPADGWIEFDMWNRMYPAGYRSDTTVTDLMSLLTFKHGYTLPANDTLTIWVALAAVHNADSHAAGLDSLKLAIDKAQKFSEKLGALCYSTCCWYRRGNINGGLREWPDLSDLSLLIAHLTTTEVTLSCPFEADINASGGETPQVDLSDLSCLIGHLTQNPQPTCLADCPR